MAGSSTAELYELFDQLCRAPDDASVLLVQILQGIQRVAQAIARRRAERGLSAQHLEAVEQMLASVFADVDRGESAAAPTIDDFASRARALCAELLITIAPPATHPEPQRLDELAREARALLRNVAS